eukprot:2770736-Pleurochrysis_carterae.AAC.1
MASGGGVSATKTITCTLRQIERAFPRNRQTCCLLQNWHVSSERSSQKQHCEEARDRDEQAALGLQQTAGACCKHESANARGWRLRTECAARS